MLKFLSSVIKRKPSVRVKFHRNTNTCKDLPEYVHSPVGCTVINADEVDYGGFKRINYRVIIHTQATDAHLLRIFKELDERKYDEVTVWYYNSIDEIRQFQPYTVAMLERINKKTSVRITRR